MHNVWGVALAAVYGPHFAPGFMVWTYFVFLHYAVSVCTTYVLVGAHVSQQLGVDRLVNS